VAFFAFSLAGCGSQLESLRARASFELNCPGERLELVTLGPWSTVGVRGCGKRVVYVHIGDCWLLNTDGQQQVVQAATMVQRLEDMERQRLQQQQAWEKRCTDCWRHD
jgi:hypothetical protein